MNNTLLDQLTTSALMGVTRKPPIWPVLPGAIGELITSLDNTDVAGRLLQTAGILALTEEFALEPVSVSPNNILAPAPDETLPVLASKPLRGIIGDILRNGRVEIQIELLELLTTQGLRFPPEHLPTLLDAAVKNPPLRGAVANLPGLRHRWLAALNPDWAALGLTKVGVSAKSDAEILEHGVLTERVAALQRLRTQAPDKARQWLTDALAQASAQERQELAAVLQSNLSMDDVALLGLLLQDRAKGVRKLAGLMLSCLPESDFAQRMCARMDAVINTKQRLRKTKLVVNIPETGAEDWIKGGIEEQPYQGEAAKAFWLRQAVSFTPLTWWGRRLNCTPDKALALVMGSEWGDSIIRGLGDAIVTQHDVTWADAVSVDDAIQAKFSNAPAILGIATPSIVEAMLIRSLQNNPKADGLGAVVQQAKQLSTWSLTFGDLLLSALRERIVDLRYFTLQLQDLAMHLPPGCLATATTGWDNVTDSPALNIFLKTVQLRHLIHRELTLPCA